MAYLIFSLIVLLFSVVVHEVSHGEMAYRLGDPTAKYAGRLTLDPRKHLDPMGSVILPLFLLVFTRGRGPIFGWAKPVPINPYNFRNFKRDRIKVAAAGPASNLFVALFFGSLIRFFSLPPFLLGLFEIITGLNLLLAVFNLLPVPPLDGSHILVALLPERGRKIKRFLRQYGFLLLAFILLFALRFLFGAISFLYQLISGRSPLYF